MLCAWDRGGELAGVRGGGARRRRLRAARAAVTTYGRVAALLSRGGAGGQRPHGRRGHGRPRRRGGLVAGVPGTAPRPRTRPGPCAGGRTRARRCGRGDRPRPRGSTRPPCGSDLAAALAEVRAPVGRGRRSPTCCPWRACCRSSSSRWWRRAGPPGRAGRTVDGQDERAGRLGPAPAGPGGPPPLLLVPSRRAADRVRDAVEQRSPGTRRGPAGAHAALPGLVGAARARAARGPPPAAAGHGQRAGRGARRAAGRARRGRHGPGLAGPPGAAACAAPGPSATSCARCPRAWWSTGSPPRRCPPSPVATAAPSGRPPPRCCWSWRQVQGLREDEAHDPAGIVAVAAGLVADRLDRAGGLAGGAGGAPRGRRRAGPHPRGLVARARARRRGRATCAWWATPTAAPSPSAAPSRACSSRCRGGSATPRPRCATTVLARPLGRAAAVQRVCAALGQEIHGPRVPGWSPAAARPVGPAAGPAGGSGPVRHGARRRGGGVGQPARLPRPGRRGRRGGGRAAPAPPPGAGPGALVADGGPGAQRPRRRRAAPGPGRRRRARSGSPACGPRCARSPWWRCCSSPSRPRPTPTGSTPHALERLACGPVGGGDPVRWRRLVLRARAAAAEAGGRAVSGEEALAALCDAVRDVLAGTGPGARGRRRRSRACPRRSSRRWCASWRSSPRGRGPCRTGVEEALWQVWDRLRVAERWRRTALRGGPDAVRAHADLDAAVALFDAAASWADRNPRGDVPDFVAHLRSRAVGDDRLGGDGPDDAVTVTTPDRRGRRALGRRRRRPACRTGCGPTPASAARCSASPTSSSVLAAAAPACPGAAGRVPVAGGRHRRPRRGAPAGPPARRARRAAPVPRRGVARRPRARRHRGRRRHHPAQRPVRAGRPGRGRRARHRPGRPPRRGARPGRRGRRRGHDAGRAHGRAPPGGGRPSAGGGAAAGAGAARPQARPGCWPAWPRRACGAPTPAEWSWLPGRPAGRAAGGDVHVSPVRGREVPRAARCSGTSPTSGGTGPAADRAGPGHPGPRRPGAGPGRRRRRPARGRREGLGRPRARGRLGLGAPARAASSRCSRGCRPGPRSSGPPGTRSSAPRCRSCYEVDGITVRGTIDRVERTPGRRACGWSTSRPARPWSRRPRWPRTRSSCSTSSPSGSGRSTA